MEIEVTWAEFEALKKQMELAEYGCRTSGYTAGTATVDNDEVE